MRNTSIDNRNILKRSNMPANMNTMEYARAKELGMVFA